VKVSIRLFAGLRERAGRDELELDLPDGARVADALAQVQHLAPGVSLVLAVNREYVDHDVVLHAGDELAVVPPVSGGAILDGPLSLEAVAARVQDPRAGAVVTFSGTTRDVAFLDYEAYVEMAAAKIDAIVAEAVERHGLCRAAADHRYGRVPLGEASVVVAASAPHRGEAFAGAREIIDAIKAQAPIWKREEGAWKEGTVPTRGMSETAPDAPRIFDIAATSPPAVAPTILDVAVDARLDHGAHVLVVHGQAEAEARVGWLGGRFHQLRCDEPLEVVRGDIVEIRRLRDDELLGEATVLDADAARHGPANDALVRLVALAERRRRGRTAAAGRRGTRARAALRRRRRSAAGRHRPHVPRARCALRASGGRTRRPAPTRHPRARGLRVGTPPSS
jgi:molybdopterin synthase catalytic subunit/molybdopterin converting factor small subunit